MKFGKYRIREKSPLWWTIEVISIAAVSFLMFMACFKLGGL